MSDLGRGVTGEVLHVDAGYHVVGIKNPTQAGHDDQHQNAWNNIHCHSGASKAREPGIRRNIKNGSGSAVHRYALHARPE